MTKDEALKMAKEALMFYGIGIVRDNSLAYAAHKAIDEALESQEQEPVTLKFPTMLRKMWSGGEVQKWLDNQEPLYTHPAPSWQGLSDDEIAVIIGNGAFYELGDVDFAHAIEQALKEKNNGI